MSDFIPAVVVAAEAKLSAACRASRDAFAVWEASGCADDVAYASWHAAYRRVARAERAFTRACEAAGYPPSAGAV